MAYLVEISAFYAGTLYQCVRNIWKDLEKKNMKRISKVLMPL